MQKPHHLVGFLSDSLLFIPITAEFPDCPYQQIFRRMLHINKFENTCLITGRLQQIGTQCIRDKRRKPLLDYTVLKERRQCFIMNLSVYLMLTLLFGIY